MLTLFKDLSLHSSLGLIGFSLLVFAGVDTPFIQERTQKVNQKTDLNNPPSIPAPTMQDLMQVDETFVYNVTYSFFTLGKIYVEVINDSLYNGRQTYHLQTRIVSNPSIPFMEQERNHYNSLMFIADSTPRTAVFWKDDLDKGIYKETRYLFDRKADKVFTFEKGEPRDTLALEEPASSGHILFYFSRIFAGTGVPYRIPIYIDHEKGYLRTRNPARTEQRSYPAFEQPIRTYRTTGHANVNGPFGFSGDFKAWFSASPYRIPLEAHVKVWLGHVKVRLVEYKRN